MVDMTKVRDRAAEHAAAAAENEKEKLANDTGVPTGGDTILMDEVRDRATAMANEENVLQESLLSSRMSPKTEWNTGQVDPSAFDSYIAGVGDSITVGNYGTYKAGIEATGNPLFGFLNLMSNVITDPLVDDLRQEEAVDRTLSAHPMAALAGQLTGAVGTGVATGGLANAGTALRVGPWTSTVKPAYIGSKIGPWVTKTGSFLANTPIGRMLGATAVGGGEGGVYNYSKGENVAVGTGIGAITGGAGQAAVGEGLPYLLGGKSVTSARQALGSAMKSGQKGLDPNVRPVQSAVDRARELGPLSTVADVDPGAMSFAESKLNSPFRHEEMYEFENTIRSRAGDPIVNPTGRDTVISNYREQINSLIPPQFKRVAGNVDTSRPMDMIASDKKAYFETISKQFGDMLGNSPVRYNPVTVRKQTTKFLTEGSPDLVARADKQQIDKILTNVIPTKKVSKKGGARGEKQVVEQAITPTQLHTARTDIDRMINSEYEKKIPDTSRVRRLANARNYISAQLDKVEGFKELNSLYSGEGSYERAANLGYDMLSTSQRSVSPEMAQSILASSTDFDLQGLLEGVSRRIVENLGAAGGEMRSARTISRNDMIGQKLITVFGEKGEQMIDAANRALELNDNTARLIRGSDTGRRATLAAKDAPTTNVFDVALVTGALVNGLTDRQVNSTASGIGAVRRLLPGQTDPKETEEMARLLANQGPEGVRQTMMETQQAQMAPGGLRTFAGMDATLAARQGNVPPSLMDTIMTSDIGQAPAFSLDNLVNYMLQNDPAMMERRSDEREARANE